MGTCQQEVFSCEEISRAYYYGMSRSLRTIIRTRYQAMTNLEKGAVRRSMGLYPKSFYEAIHDIRCTARVASAIATAFGFPERWPELVIFKERK